MNMTEVLPGTRLNFSMHTIEALVCINNQTCPDAISIQPGNQLLGLPKAWKLLCIVLVLQHPCRQTIEVPVDNL